MSKDEPFETSEFSIAWAKDHIDELKREIVNFVNDEDASTIFTETSSNGLWEMIKFKLCKPMPRPLRGHTSDAAINLRNALDQAICSVFALAGIPKDTTYFPIARSHKIFEDTLTKGWCKGLPQDIADLLRRSKPYKGRNDLLWALHRLANTNKHGILQPMMPSNLILKREGFAMGFYEFDPPRWDSAKNELVLAKVPVGNKFKIDYETVPLIAFNEIEFITGQEVVTTLYEFVDVVEGIVMAIKAESKRIGLF